MTLTEFLLARIAEDEAVAREATAGPWEVSYLYGACQVQTVERFGASPEYAQPLAITMDYEGLSDSIDFADGQHVARWNPARVLTECEAKRRIVEYARSYGGVDREELPQPHRALQVTYTEVCAFLALPYADHPDYQPEWRP